MATLGTQDTGRRQTKHRKLRKSKQEEFEDTRGVKSESVNRITNLV